MLVVPAPMGYTRKLGCLGAGWVTVVSVGWMMMVSSVGWVTVAKTEQRMVSSVGWVTVANTEWGMALHARVDG